MFINKTETTHGNCSYKFVCIALNIKLCGYGSSLLYDKTQIQWGPPHNTLTRVWALIFPKLCFTEFSGSIVNCKPASSVRCNVKANWFSSHTVPENQRQVSPSWYYSRKDFDNPQLSLYPMRVLAVLGSANDCRGISLWSPENFKKMKFLKRNRVSFFSGVKQFHKLLYCQQNFHFFRHIINCSTWQLIS